MRVLIVKTSSMGDVLQTLPSLTDAIQAIPDICFDWIVEEDLVQIPTWHKAVSKIIPVAIRRWRKSWFSKSTKNEREAFWQELYMQSYEIVIDAQGLFKSAILVKHLIHAVKHGMNWQTAREPLASLFYNYCHHIEKKQHAVERIRELFSKSLGYSKPKIYGNYGISKCFPHKKLINITSPYIVFLHSTTHKNKHWPETYWRKLIELIPSKDIHVKLLWRTEHERRRAERLSIGISYVDILPRLSLSMVAEKLAGALVVVSVDTGLSHLAAALDIPNITLFGPTDPSLIGGYGKNQYYLTSPTKKMRDIKVYEVFILLKKIISKLN